ncbi:MAG TPA: CerR family C-terminal domain-containing protein [Vicinamibacterales bacterium]|nr:CerR family C-terminal domain-containing protein [Vicinamibacterales bacterium]
MRTNGAVAVRADRETRERLLDAAERLFAERGFRHVTVREICQAAQANVAAVNYHFGDKLGLYREIVQTAIDRMRATTDAAREAGAGQPPEEQLRRYITTVNRRLLAASDGTLHRLIAREMYDPTPALDELVEQGLRPRFDHLAALVARVLGCEATDARVVRCAASIQAQTVAYMPNAVADRIGTRGTLTGGRIDEIASHIAEFSLAGLDAIRRHRKRR